jgi:hypothetical protein
VGQISRDVVARLKRERGLGCFGGLAAGVVTFMATVLCLCFFVAAPCRVEFLRLLLLLLLLRLHVDCSPNIGLSV